MARPPRSPRSGRPGGGAPTGSGPRERGGSRGGTGQPPQDGGSRKDARGPRPPARNQAPARDQTKPEWAKPERAKPERARPHTPRPARGDDRPPAPARGRRAEPAGGSEGGAEGREPRRIGRMRPGDVWIYGRHAVGAVLANPARRVRKLLGTAEALNDLAEALDNAEAELPDAGPDLVEREDLDLLLGERTVHQGIAVRVDPLDGWAVEDIVRAAEGAERVLVVVLDQVTDPHNVGAVLRSAAAFGALAVIIPDRHSPDETGTLAKAASGALERVPLCRASNLARALDILREAGIWTVGLDAEAPVTLGRSGLSGRLAVVLGAEGEGLRRLTRERCDHLARLPMVPEAVESLNVSNAAAIAMYELSRETLDPAAPAG